MSKGRCKIGVHVFVPIGTAVVEEERVDGTIEINSKIQEKCCFCSKERVKTRRGVWRLIDNELVLDKEAPSLILPPRFKIDIEVATKILLSVVILAVPVGSLFLMPLTLLAIVFFLSTIVIALILISGIWEGHKDRKA